MVQLRALWLIYKECTAFQQYWCLVCCRRCRLGENVLSVRQWVSWRRRLLSKSSDNMWWNVDSLFSVFSSEFCLEASFLAFPYKSVITKSAGKVTAIIVCDTYCVVLNHFVPPKRQSRGTIMQHNLERILWRQ
jgi:hypothetical protein